MEGVTGTQTNVFINKLTICFDPDGPSSGDCWGMYTWWRNIFKLHVKSSTSTWWWPIWAETCCELINKNICLCDDNPPIFICKHHKQDATLHDGVYIFSKCEFSEFALLHYFFDYILQRESLFSNLPFIFYVCPRTSRLRGKHACLVLGRIQVRAPSRRPTILSLIFADLHRFFRRIPK
jgi:hypothetical protein